MAIYTINSTKKVVLARCIQISYNFDKAMLVLNLRD